MSQENAVSTCEKTFGNCLSSITLWVVACTGSCSASSINRLPSRPQLWNASTSSLYFSEQNSANIKGSFDRETGEGHVCIFRRSVLGCLKTDTPQWFVSICVLDRKRCMCKINIMIHISRLILFSASERVAWICNILHRNPSIHFSSIFNVFCKHHSFRSFWWKPGARATGAAVVRKPHWPPTGVFSFS